MANNPYVNKVQLADGTTVIDLSQDTVTDASHIMAGYVGHLADGTQVTGTGVGFTEETKEALLACFEKVAWIDENGQYYYDALYEALYNKLHITNDLTNCTTSNSAQQITSGNSYSATITASSGYTLTGAEVSVTMGGTDITSTAYSNGTISIASVTGALVITISAAMIEVSSISAVYTQGGAVYGSDTLNSLKDDLVVTATLTDTTTVTVPSANYTLSGALTDGTSTITVTYSGKTTTFNVTVTWLPSTHQLVEYIEGTGTQYITTNINSRLPMACEAEAAMTVEDVGQFIGAGSSSDGAARFFFVGISRGVFGQGSYSGNYFAMRAGSGLEGYTPGSSYNSNAAWVRALPDLTLNQKHYINSSIDSNGKQTIYVDDYASSSLTKTKPNTGYPIQLFKQSNTSVITSAKIYSVKLSSGNTMLSYLVPCYRKSDSVAGVYDVVNDQFYTNAGTGTFVLGSDI